MNSYKICKRKKKTTFDLQRNEYKQKYKRREEERESIITYDFDISTFRQLCNSFASSMTVSSPYYAYMEGHPLAYINLLYIAIHFIGKNCKRVRDF